MSIDVNKEVVRRFLNEAWNLGNLSIIDQLLSPEYCRHIATEPYLLSRDAQRLWIAEVHHSFPDLHLTLEEVIGECNTVVFRGLMRGKHMNAFRDIEPTHMPIVLMVMGILRVEDGCIVEQWGGVSEIDIEQEALVRGIRMVQHHKLELPSIMYSRVTNSSSIIAG